MELIVCIIGLVVVTYLSCRPDTVNERKSKEFGKGEGLFQDGSLQPPFSLDNERVDQNLNDDKTSWGNYR
jgi:hypothetical protein